MWALFSCSEMGLLFVVGQGLLIMVASPVAEHRPYAHRFSSHGACAELFRGMWDLLGPGIETVSSELTGGFFTSGRFFTSGPPGKFQKSLK